MKKKKSTFSSFYKESKTKKQSSKTKKQNKKAKQKSKAVYFTPEPSSLQYNVII
jgi:hypothetical protein